MKGKTPVEKLIAAGAAEEASEARTIELTPDFDALFRMFTREAKLKADGLLRESGAEELRRLQGVLAPLNVAAQSMTNREAVEAFREVLADIVAKVDERAGKLEADAEELEEEEARS